MKNLIFVITFLSLRFLCLNLTQNQYKEMEVKFNGLTSELPFTRGMSNGDREYRKALFFENVALIEEENKKAEGKGELEVNFFALLNEKEKKGYLGFEGKVEGSDDENDENSQNSQSDENDENDDEPEGDEPVFTDIPIKKVKMKGSKKRRKLINKGVKQLKQKTGTLGNLNVSYNNLNKYEKSWVNYWIRQLATLDRYYIRWYNEAIARCQYYINRYGRITAVKNYCNYQYYNRVLPTHQRNIGRYLIYIRNSYVYYVYRYRYKSRYQKLKQYYPKLRLAVIVAEKRFQDQVTAKFEAFMKGFKSGNNSVQNTSVKTIQQAVLQGIIPRSVNWVAKKKVTPVRNQGGCGSCWAFSALGMLESATLMQKKKQVDLSEQYQVNCDKTNYGCRGGLMSRALAYIQKNQTTYEKNFPYTATQGSCPSNKPQFKIKSVKSLTRGRDILLFLKTLSKRPVTFAYHVSRYFPYIRKNYVIPWYHQGICPRNGRPNHAVLAVGYYVDPNNANNIWINLKNSWGSRWGTNGYFKLGINNNISSYGHGTCNFLYYYREIRWAYVS